MKTLSENTPSRRPAATPQVQTKLNIGKPNDRYEQEADRVADKVVNQSGTQPTAVQPRGQMHSSSQPNVQLSEEEEEVQAKSNSTGQATASKTVSDGIKSSKGGGSPLPSQVQANMENQIGADFSKVRVHTDSKAQQMSKDLNAQAFTVGNDVYFNKGKYNPETKTGKHLLAHELTHTVQQGAALPMQVQKKDDDELEIPDYKLTAPQLGDSLNSQKPGFGIGKLKLDDSIKQDIENLPPQPMPTPQELIEGPKDNRMDPIIVPPSKEPESEKEKAGVHFKGKFKPKGVEGVVKNIVKDPKIEPFVTGKITKGLKEDIPINKDGLKKLGVSEETIKKLGKGFEVMLGIRIRWK